MSLSIRFLELVDFVMLVLSQFAKIARFYVEKPRDIVDYEQGLKLWKLAAGKADYGEDGLCPALLRNCLCLGLTI
jgi:hypothetical protein